MTDIDALIAEARRSADALRNAPFGIDRDTYAVGVDALASALESTTARLREAEAERDKADALAAHFTGRAMEAEAVIEAIDAIVPMWPRGMYGAPQDMIGRNQIRPIITRYKTTKTEGSAHWNHTPGVYQDTTERNENGKES